jgi:hypothetical protein
MRLDLRWQTAVGNFLQAIGQARFQIAAVDPCGAPGEMAVPQLPQVGQRQGGQSRHLGGGGWGEFHRQLLTEREFMDALWEAEAKT